MKQSKKTGTDGYFDVYNFVCEGCKSEGELKVDRRDGMQPFGCPEGCGATYVPYQDGLMCVVKPVFVKSEVSE